MQLVRQFLNFLRTWKESSLTLVVPNGVWRDLWVLAALKSLALEPKLGLAADLIKFYIIFNQKINNYIYGLQLIMNIKF